MSVPESGRSVGWATRSSGLGLEDVYSMMAETETMPSLSLKEDCQNESDCLSDSDLPSGLPSPDASDDEDIRNCSDRGITTPYFFNKLREKTRPLFHNIHNLSPYGVNESAVDRPSKSSRLKKRNVRENKATITPDNENASIIERHYGYIPNPRWPKALSHAKNFNPRGLWKEDETSIPGIVFRDRSRRDHSFQDIDFPELNSTSKDDSSFLGLQGDASTSHAKRLSFETSRDGGSPVTSTPLRHNFSSSHDASLFEKSSALSNVEEIPKDDLRLEDDINKKPDSKNKSTRNNRRRSKKVLLSPLVGTSSKPSDQSLSDSSDFNSSNSFFPTQCQRSLEEVKSQLSVSSKIQSQNENNSASDVQHKVISCRSKTERRSGSFQSSQISSLAQTLRDEKFGHESEKDKNHHTSTSFEDKNGVNNNVIKSPSWSQIASRGSSPVPWNNPTEGPVHKSNQSPLTVDVQQPSNSSWSQLIKVSSPMPSPVVSKKVKEVTTMQSVVEPLKAKNNRLSNGEAQGNSRRKSGSKSSPIVTVDNLSSRISSNSPLTVERSRPASPFQEIKPANYILPGKDLTKGNPNENKRRNSIEKGKVKNNTRQSIERQNNITNNKGCSRRGEAQRAKLLTLDSFITPKKSSNDSWPSNCPKDMNAFENRFVENIVASATSPPKKVRPSPIKKLNFSFQGDKHSSSESETTKNESNQSETDISKAPIYRRQLSLIRDFDWQKEDLSGGECQKQSRDASTKSAHSSSRKSLENHLKNEKKTKKDVVLEDEDDIVQDGGEFERKVEQFWRKKSFDVPSKSKDDQLKLRATQPASDIIELVKDSQEEDIYQYYPKALQHKSQLTVDQFLSMASQNDVVDPTKVTFKAQLKKYARRYCYVVEEHHIASISEEIHFILQLLTSCQLDQEMLLAVDLKLGGTVFRSVHNSVYFAVHIMKKLRRLFMCLPFPIVYLLAHDLRIKAFSPKLHACFMTSLSSRRPETERASPLDNNPIRTSDNGIESFPDTNFAHVFKCQRDNFFALYRQYHDRDGVHPFSMEEQIQYVYDSKTPEQNSVTNLIHLTELFVDHLVQCCLIKADDERKDILRMMESQGGDDGIFESHLSSYLSHLVASSGSPTPTGHNKGSVKVEAFFFDFIQVLRCPAFNEHLKNLLVSRILKLNGHSFGCVRNLHSSVIVGDDKTPERCEDFGSTVLSLCAMGKILGHLIFLPYKAGAQDLPVHQEASMLRMREMVPLPVPLPLLLKQAFEDGHLSLTVPWVVDYLTMMDQAAPKLSVYKSLLQHLKYIQRYAWKMLYMNGHHSSGLLTVLSTTKLFQMNSMPAHLSMFCDEHLSEPMKEPSGNRHIDVQRLVSSTLLFASCPQIVQSCAPLIDLTMQQVSPHMLRKIIPLVPKLSDNCKETVVKTEEAEEIRQWLGLSLVERRKTSNALYQREDKQEDTSHLSCFQREIDLPHLASQVFSKLDKIQNDLKVNFIDGTPYLRSTMNTAVDLLCGKVQEYTLNTILKVGAFETKHKVRSKFLDKGNDAETVKSQVLIHSNILANKMSSEVRYAFFQLCETTCKKDLNQLLCFLASGIEEQSKDLMVKIAQDMMVQRLKEWASIQLGPELFKRLIIREAEKCARPNGKTLSMFPSDFSQKVEQTEVDFDLKDGFADLHQLSEIMDRALSCGVWYINSLTAGPRPDDAFMLNLLNDLILCLGKRMVTIDFAFYVMANFLMHLIIQYIMDAPFNWTEACLEAFIKLCLLCEERKVEDDRQSIRLAETVSKTRHVKVKVANFVSVFSLQWISKSTMLDHSLMVYCQTLVRLVEAGLMMVETLVCKLTVARNNHHVTDLTRNMVDRILFKVLTLLYSSGCHSKTCNQERVVSLFTSVKLYLEDWGSVQILEELISFFDSVL